MDNPTETQENNEQYIKEPKRLTALIDHLALILIPGKADDSDDSPEFLARGAIRIGLISILLVFGIFGIWSGFAPLNSAALAVGTVVLDSNKKTVQHLEGGIVDEILVREGTYVETGQPLLKLDETTAKARFDLLRKQFFTTKAAEARLIAERDNKTAIQFPQELIELRSNDKTVEESLDSQERLFQSRLDSLNGRISILHQRIGQFREEIRGLEAQSISATKQISLIRSEIRDVQQLVNKELAPKSRLLALQRQLASIDGERGELGAMIARAEQSIGEAELEIINTKNTFLNEIIEALKETQTALSDLEERIRASEDTFNRINIIAPIAGTITDLQVHTIGGVIKPGEKLMDIIPDDDQLIVEAMIEPQDIDIVRENLEASVRLSAYKARFVPPITGTVTQVSADIFHDPQTGASFYKARILVNAEELRALEEVELYPGMPADVQIITGTRTMLSYLFAPIRDSFNKSFREE